MKMLLIRKLKDLFPKKGAQRNILLRSFFFLLTVFTYSLLRDMYTDQYYAYKLLLSDGFVKYSLYALVVLFFFVNWDKLKNTKQIFLKTPEILVSLFIAFALFFIPATVFSLHKEIDLIFFEYIFGFLSGFALFILFFGIEFFKRFAQEIFFLILILLPLKLSPILIDHFWQYSSTVTIFGLRLLLPLIQVPYTIEADKYRVMVGDFDAYIGPPCAGIHSLLAFTLLFIFTLFLLLQKNYRLRVPYLTGMFLIGLASVFLLNSIRVLSIMLVGAYYSKDFAVNAFHNHIGAVLFLVFFIFYITFFLKKSVKS